MNVTGWPYKVAFMVKDGGGLSFSLNAVGIGVLVFRLFLCTGLMIWFRFVEFVQVLFIGSEMVEMEGRLT